MINVQQIFDRYSQLYNLKQSLNTMKISMTSFCFTLNSGLNSSLHFLVFRRIYVLFKICLLKMFAFLLLFQDGTVCVTSDSLHFTCNKLSQCTHIIFQPESRDSTPLSQMTHRSLIVCHYTDKSMTHLNESFDSKFIMCVTSYDLKSTELSYPRAITL